MSFSTYISQPTYIDPMSGILEPDPTVMVKPETQRLETQYKPLLSQFLDTQHRMREDFDMREKSADFNFAFFAVAAIGIIYVYIFVRMLMR